MKNKVKEKRGKKKNFEYSPNGSLPAGLWHLLIPRLLLLPLSCTAPPAMWIEYSNIILIYFLRGRGRSARLRRSRGKEREGPEKKKTFNIELRNLYNQVFQNINRLLFFIY